MKVFKVIFVGMLSGCLGISLYAQKVSVASMKHNVVVIGKINPLSIVVENCDCRNLSVSTDNGTIKRDGECTFDYTPARLGMAQIVVSCRGTKAPTNYLMRVVNEGDIPVGATDAPGGNNASPGVHAELDKRAGGYIRKPVLEAQIGLALTDGSKRYVLDQFFVAVYRGNQQLYAAYNTGARFKEELITMLRTLKPGDRVLFFNMQCTALGKVNIPPAEFIVF